MDSILSEKFAIIKESKKPLGLGILAGLSGLFSYVIPVIEAHLSFAQMIPKKNPKFMEILIGVLPIIWAVLSGTQLAYLEAVSN